MTRAPLLAGLFESCNAELAALAERKDLSSYLDVNRLLTKSFLLSCASFYEDHITSLVRAVLESSNHQPSVNTWLVTVAVEGQFYKWFNFRSAKNTNAFLSTFGAEFKGQARSLIDARTTRQQGEKDFLILCQARNECVHRNYAAHSLDYTLDELYGKHKSAMRYIRLVEYCSRKWLVAP